MNSCGRIFRLHILGESHGPGVGVVIDGCPAGLPLGPDDFAADLERRRPRGAGGTPRRETDRPRLLSGWWRGHTTGAPLALWIDNGDVDSSAYDELEHLPRPGHADLVARRKYGGFNDPRGGGHFSGRLTAPLVAAGVVAKKLLAGVDITARVLEVGGERDFTEAVARAREEGDSLGGLVECVARGVPAGLGEPFFDSLESLLAHLLFSLGGVRGVEFGTGFASAHLRGSECNDPLVDTAGRTASNHAGGINGGISNGNPLVLRVAFKPPSSIAREQHTVDLRSGEITTLKVGGRHDACIALRAPVIVEACCACVLVDLMLLAGRLPPVLPRRGG